MTEPLPLLPRIDVYHGHDGCPVIEIDTSASGEIAHDADGVPYLRVAVNDYDIHEHSPLEPLPGSLTALKIELPWDGPHDETHSLDPADPPGKMTRLYELANDQETAMLDALRLRAGVVWEHEACATNLATSNSCERCGRLRDDLADAGELRP